VEHHGCFAKGVLAGPLVFFLSEVAMIVRGIKMCPKNKVFQTGFQIIGAFRKSSTWQHTHGWLFTSDALFCKAEKNTRLPDRHAVRTAPPTDFRCVEK
jgi:hypothetical protein